MTAWSTRCLENRRKTPAASICSTIAPTASVDYFDSGGASVKLFAQGTANGYFPWVPVTADWLSNAL